MKIILVGYPGSQQIVPASKYLLEKYLPGFDLYFLNWIGEKSGWSTFVASYLAQLDDKFIIFALDDYLISGSIREDIYKLALNQFERKDAVAVKLFRCSIEEHIGYPVTTQYTIWNREFLINLLSKTTDPWDFEINGSKIFREMDVVSFRDDEVALEYNTSSCLSSRWSGIRWDGLSQKDIEHIKANLIK